MKERWYYLKTKFYLNIAKWLAKPYRWVLLHLSVEKKLEHVKRIYQLCDILEGLQDEFPEARNIRYVYLLIGLAVAMDGIKQIEEKYPQLINQDN